MVEYRRQWSSKSILIAEDDDINFSFLEAMLEETGIRIFRAYNGEEAIEMFSNRKPFDIVMLDIRMPVKDGLQVISEIRKEDNSTKVIAQTAYPDTPDFTDFRGFGFNAVLNKPIEPIHFFNLLDKYLQE
jgi:CheY-like chemotaxis protein